MAMRVDRRQGFSLIEIIVVMTIIAMLFGLGLPGIISAQRRLDNNNTLNVITAVHNACVRNARQVGATGVIYGFALAFQSDASPVDRKCVRVIPWALEPGGTNYKYVMNTALPVDKQMGEALSRAKADIGGTIPWDAPPAAFNASYMPTITFMDQQAPAKAVILGSSTESADDMSIFIAYEPGTAFVHAVKTSALASPGFSLGAGEMSAANRKLVKLNIWNIRQKRSAYTISISAVGVLDVKNG